MSKPGVRADDWKKGGREREDGQRGGGDATGMRGEKLGCQLEERDATARTPVYEIDGICRDAAISSSPFVFTASMVFTVPTSIWVCFPSS